MQDSVAVQASVPTFERSHRAFHRERTVTSTPCAESFAGVTGDVAVGIFPANSLHAAPRAYKLYGGAARRTAFGTAGQRGNFEESDAKLRLFTRRKFYVTVYFFLTSRRHSPPFFETESLHARAFGARQFLRTLTGV